MTDPVEVTEQIITIGVVDDHQVLTEALALVIKYEAGLQFVGAAGDCAEARQLVEQTKPKVLLLDVHLPDGDGLTLVSELKQVSPETQVLVLTSASDEDTLLRAVDVGVSGFVVKSQPMSTMLAAIRQAAEGEIVMSHSLLMSVLARKARRHEENQDMRPLTAREAEILELMAMGKSNQVISDALNISALTVRTHSRNLLGKLGAHSRLEAVAIALRRGLIEPPD